MKASNNINSGSSTFSILHQNPNFTTLKATLPADVSSCFPSYEHQIIIQREEVENIRRPNKSSSPPVVDDSELSIFDARNYFNDPIVHDNSTSTTTTHKQQKQIINAPPPPPPPPHRHNSVVLNPESSRLCSSLVADGFRLRSGTVRSYATPTASSEASWNSHTGLLTNPPAAGALNISESSLISSSRRKKKGAGPAAAARWFLLGCKTCPCSGKKSAQVKIIKPTTPTSRLNKDQVLIHPPLAASNSMHMQQQQQQQLEEADSDRIVANSSYTCSRISLGGVGGGGFTFPDLLNPPTKNSSPMMNKVFINTISRRAAAAASAIHHLPHDDMMMMAAEPTPFAMQEDPPRDSLEVFQSSGAGGDGSSSRKSVVIKASSRDDDHLVVAAASPSRPRPRPDDTDDMGSDASSDLFEIESFSTTTDQQYSSSYPIRTTRYAAAAAAAATGRHRDSLDEARPRFSTANNNNSNYYDDEYEPSEASVAWTVTTAAYDQASMAGCSVSASDVEEFTRLQLRLHHHLLSADQNNNNNERRQIRSDPSVTGTSGSSSGGGLLMSCRCEKAVNVGPDPVKFHLPPSRGGEGGGGGLGYNSRHVSGRADGGRSTTSHAARLSLAFAT